MPEEHDRLLTQREAATYLHLSIRTLQRWRTLGIGPASIVLPNGYRRYRMSALDAWLEAHGRPEGG